MKFLFGSTASSHFLQNRVNWILEQHIFQFSASLANSSLNKTYAGIQLQSLSLAAREAPWPFQFGSSFVEHPRLWLQQQ